ncbi:hypothetical protein IFM89_031807 [Coptis chinensis]|uniref:Protein kinase domain-containing protein n=1 Tax=Coptis chinensis TaxID=261450 RepID=A0A835LXA5_9MAGN|nr:hypothetical protein IFM89_031807 [Coptis chinensis]
MGLLPIILVFFISIMMFPLTCKAQIQNPFIYSAEKFNNSQYSFLTALDSTIDSTGAIQITPDTISNISIRQNKSGRIMMTRNFTLWESNTNSSGVVASFNSTFLVNFYVPPPELPGEGFTFIIAPDLTIPLNSHGEWLGITNATNDNNTSNKFVAIELDTKKQDYDPDDNHMGLNINSVRSHKTVSLSKPDMAIAPFNAAVKYNVWVQYNGRTKFLEVYMDKEDKPKPSLPILNESINLKDYVNQISYFGFSASTGTTAQLNCLLKWNLTVEILPTGEIPPKGKKHWIKVGIGVGVVAVGLMVTCLVGLVYYLKKKDVDELNISSALMSLPGIPREFKFKDLKQATNNFDEKMKLGKGGFGVVYRGVLVKENLEVAVKKFSRGSIEGKADFLAELAIINRLRHKHLVRLIGWCHKSGMLLLVYEFMPNGSLDNHLFNGPDKFLSWAQRYKIISGLASALHYLHNEYDQMVVHRDLKSSNILLDSDYNARLGDFGLARALEHGRTSYAEIEGVPGTFGYIAPETFHAGKATRESDVFGFGAVVLEVVCGQRPWTRILGSLVMVDWVWKLYREGRILDAIDERLGTAYVVEEAVRLLLLGLACSHPIASERPKADTIFQIVCGLVPVPDVPHFKPAFVWPMVRSTLDSNTSNTMGTTGSTSSYYESPYLLSRESYVQNIDIMTK